MEKRTKKLLIFAGSVIVAGLVGLFVIHESANTMAQNFRSGSPFNPSAHQLLGR